jgi:hypothetical protein
VVRVVALFGYVRHSNAKTNAGKCTRSFWREREHAVHEAFNSGNPALQADGV